MHRSLRVATALGVVVAAAIPSAVSAASRAAKRTFKETDVNVSVPGSTTGEALGKATSSAFGKGAYVSTSTHSGLTGTDHYTEYFAKGSETGSDKFTLGIPNAAGVGTITGTGTCKGVTGVLKSHKCSYKFAGTYHAKTGVTTSRETGTIT